MYLLSLTLTLVLFHADPSTAEMKGGDKKVKIEKNLEGVDPLGKEVLACIKAKSQECLKKHIVDFLYFPQYDDFGCDKPALPMKPEGRYPTELYARCILRSRVKNEALTVPLTLRDVIKQCFLDPKSNRHGGNTVTITTPECYLCELEKGPSGLLLSAVIAADCPGPAVQAEACEAGGYCWDWDKNVCRRDEPNAKELCAKSESKKK